MGAIMYRRVYDRKDPIEVSVEDVIFNEGKLFNLLGEVGYKKNT